jgi:GTP diphosphokinase / guanosine-3',5'-bis(diphosphate) 3'-diphosphatase
MGFLHVTCCLSFSRSVRVRSVEAMSYEQIFRDLSERLGSELTATELALVGKAFEFAREAHAGQMRDEGTPYIVHPVRVAATLVNELCLFTPRLVCAALLHDVIEDSATTRQQIAELFNEEIAEVVWLLTKLEEVTLAEYLSEIEARSETGAPIVKLCDRLDNLRFLTCSPRTEKIQRYIRTTEAYYLPMAARTNAYVHDQMGLMLNLARIHLEEVSSQ